MNEIKTVTGLELSEAIERLREPLDEGAYKPIPGARGLTVIDPYFTLERVTEVFGLVGIGWKFDYSADEIQIKNAIQGDFEALEAQVHIRLSYCLEIDGTLQWSEPVLANGGSTNSSEHYAIRGAITNALGSAWSRLTFQLGIYQGNGAKGKGNGSEPKRRAQTNGTPSAHYWQAVEARDMSKAHGQEILSECGGDYAHALEQLETME